MAVTDLSFGGFGQTWGHTRIYNNQLSQDHDFSNGWNWMVRQWGYLVQQESQIAVVRSVRNTIYFEADGNGGFIPLYGAAYRLTHDSDAHVFRMQVPSGAIFEFHDFDQVGAPKGLFKSRTSPGGQTIAVTSYTAGRPGLVRRSGDGVTEELVYFYAGSNLQRVLLRRIVDTTVSLLRRVDFTYYGSPDANGLPGDLKTATHQRFESAGWISTGTYYYRYYTDSAGSGFPHGLKYALEPQAFEELSNAPGVTDPFTAPDSVVASFADYYFEYDDQDRVTKERVAGGSREYGLSYTTNSPPPINDYENWKTRTVESRPDGSEVIVFTNFLGQVLLRELRSGEDRWIEGQFFDDQGHMIYKAPPAAISDYTYNASGITPVFRLTPCAIQAREYYLETDIDNGHVKGYVSAEKLVKVPSFEEVALREFKYTEHRPSEESAEVVYAISQEIVYPHEEDQSDPIITNWEYDYYAGTMQIKQKTLILPAVPISQNGSGVSAQRREFYDEYGYLKATQDERGFINTYTYDPTRGTLLKQVLDDDPPSGSGWSVNSGTRLKLTTDFEYDQFARQVQSLGPAHNVNGTMVRTATWTVYDDEHHRTLTARGFATGSAPNYTYTLVNPVNLSFTDADGKPMDTVQSIRASTAGRLTIDDLNDLLDQDNWCRCTHQEYNDAGQLAETWVYHLIPASGFGSEGTNYVKTSYLYDDMGRQSGIRSPAGTITRSTFDVRGLTLEQWVGTNDKDFSAQNFETSGTNNLVKIAAMEYDNGVAGFNGNLTKMTQPVDATSGNDRVTQYGYDYRDRQVWIDGEINFYRESTYDNLNRIYRTDQRDTNQSGNLVARTETAFDTRGRAYQATRYAVDPSSGLVGNALIDNTWYDEAGNSIKSLPARSQLFTKSLYDGVRRTTAQYQGYYTGGGTEPYNDVGQVTTSNTIFDQTLSTYDDASNLVFSSRFQRFHDATGSGALNGPLGSQPRARVSYQAMWYDEIGRSIATANYGTNDNASPPTRPASPPASSDAILVSLTDYNERGGAS